MQLMLLWVLFSQSSLPKLPFNLLCLPKYQLVYPMQFRILFDLRLTVFSLLSRMSKLSKCY